jgi:hypothetical protein
MSLSCVPFSHRTHKRKKSHIASKSRNEPPDFADAKYMCSFPPNQKLPLRSQSANTAAETEEAAAMISCV